MDTRYWGPSGWKLLHTITFSYAPELKETYKEFFTTIAYILPCKHCRKSYTEYILQDPIDNESRLSMTQWLWRIHNMVNAKLRSQGLLKTKNPTFLQVEDIYNKKLSEGCVNVNFEGWEFLFSTVESHPYSKLSLGSKPFDFNSDIIDTSDPLQQNMYNFMSAADKLKYFTKFWKLLPKVLPFPSWRSSWEKYDNLEWSTRQSSLENLYTIRCGLENDLKLQNKKCYRLLCKELRSYKSGCNKSKRTKTCRRVKRTGRVKKTRLFKKTRTTR